MRKFIVVRTQFEATHCWPSCPDGGFDFLRHEHRHMFHVEVKMLVTHNDRDLEFIQVKEAITRFLNRWKGNLGSMSCEDIAESIIESFSYPITSVSVFEDNENGAVIEV
jgi:hypothetical protein